MLSKLTPGLVAGIGAVVLVVAVLAWFVDVKIDGNADQSNAAQAKAEIKIIAAALAEFRKAHGRYPERIDGLQSSGQPHDGAGPSLSGKSIPKDPWGTPYIYRPGQGGYVLYSAGPNRRDDSQANDDVAVRPN